MKARRKIQWLALSFLTIFILNACSVEDTPSLSLKEILVDKSWRVETYLVDPLVGWKKSGYRSWCRGDSSNFKCHYHHPE